MKNTIIIMSAILMLIVTNVCSAMNISQPEKIGEIIGINFDGFKFKQKLTNDGDIRHANPNGAHAYGKGIATFGNNTKRLYLHYQTYGYYNKSPQISKYGGISPDNAIQIDTLDNKIFMLKTNENITLYIIYSDYDLPGEDDYTLIGERQDGRFVKYLETDKIFEQYYGKNNKVVQYVKDVEVQGDTIIFKYGKWDWNTRPGPKDAVGEIRCKWDENAQWFAVENVVY